MKPLSPDAWAQLKILFDRALALDEKERAKFIESVEAAEPLLAEELKSLLPFTSPDKDFLESSLAVEFHPAFPTLDSFQPGQEVFGFRILETLGEGSFGRVYRAIELALNREVAIKVSPDFGDEGKLMAPLDHEHIVRVFSQRTLPEQKLRLMCMQYISGGSLQKLIDEWPKNLPFSGKNLIAKLRDATVTNPLLSSQAFKDFQTLEKLKPLETVLFLISRIADALAHAHDRKVLHLDVKPANILLTNYGKPLLTDFNVGLIKKETTSKFMGGTIKYMSPEQRAAFETPSRTNIDNIEVRSDVFSLGIVMKILSESVLSPSDQKLLAPFYLRAASPNCEARFSSASEFSNYLRSALEKREIESHLPKAGLLTKIAMQSPLAGIVTAILIPEVIASAVQISYNGTQIVGRLNASQQSLFLKVCMIWNPLIYGTAMFLLIRLFLPIRKFLLEPNSRYAEKTRRRILNYPLWVAGISTVGWTIGSLLFPASFYFASEPLPSQAVTHFFVSFGLATIISLTYSYLYAEYVGLRVFYPQAWVAETDIRKIAKTELKKTVFRHKAFFLLAGLIPLFGALLLLFGTPKDFISNDYDAFRFWISAFIGGGMMGVFLAIQLSSQLNQVIVALAGELGDKNVPEEIPWRP